MIVAPALVRSAVGIGARMSSSAAPVGHRAYQRKPPATHRGLTFEFSS
jgi:hypothetical protein